MRLVCSREVTREVAPVVCGVGEGAIRFLHPCHLTVAAVFGKDDRSMKFLCTSFKNRACLRQVFSNDYRCVRLDDASFFSSDFSKGVAEKLGVVHADVGDDGEYGRDDVGTVESTAESHLDDSDVYLLIGKILECEGSGEFKEGTVEGFEESTFLFDEVDDIVLWDRYPIDADTLSEVNEVGEVYSPTL